MNDNTVRFTAELDCKKGHIETSYDSNENLADVCYFVDNVCARLQELKSMAMIKSIEQYDEDAAPVSIPPKDQFEILGRSIETYREPIGDQYIRCLITLNSDPNVSTEHRFLLNEGIPLYDAKLLLKQYVIENAENILASLITKQQEMYLPDSEEETHS